MPTKVKPLTAAMKRIISDMRSGKSLSYSDIYETYRMSIFSLNRRTVDNLFDEGYISKGESIGFGSYTFILTERGRNTSI